MGVVSTIRNAYVNWDVAGDVNKDVGKLTFRTANELKGHASRLSDLFSGDIQNRDSEDRGHYLEVFSAKFNALKDAQLRPDKKFIDTHLLSFLEKVQNGIGKLPDSKDQLKFIVIQIKKLEEQLNKKLNILKTQASAVIKPKITSYQRAHKNLRKAIEDYGRGGGTNAQYKKFLQAETIFSRKGNKLMESTLSIPIDHSLPKKDRLDRQIRNTVRLNALKMGQKIREFKNLVFITHVSKLCTFALNENKGEGVSVAHLEAVKLQFPDSYLYFIENFTTSDGQFDAFNFIQTFNDALKEDFLTTKDSSFLIELIDKIFKTTELSLIAIKSSFDQAANYLEKELDTRNNEHPEISESILDYYSAAKHALAHFFNQNRATIFRDDLNHYAREISRLEQRMAIISRTQFLSQVVSRIDYLNKDILRLKEQISRAPLEFSEKLNKIPDANPEAYRLISEAKTRTYTRNLHKLKIHLKSREAEKVYFTQTVKPEAEEIIASVKESYSISFDHIQQENYQEFIGINFEKYTEFQNAQSLFNLAQENLEAALANTKNIHIVPRAILVEYRAAERNMSAIFSLNEGRFYKIKRAEFNKTKTKYERPDPENVLLLSLSPRWKQSSAGQIYLHEKMSGLVSAPPLVED